MSEAAPINLSSAFQKTEATPRKRLPPFSLRLTPEERAYLKQKAGRMPLGAYIKAKAFADGSPVKRRAVGLEVVDKDALAKALALLGRSHFSSNLNQLAKAANIGTLPVSPEVEQELLATCTHVKEIKVLLIRAVGLKDGAT
ncbi:MAG: hypothetical protein AAFX54_17575 [Pseudomonadota bacterium]